MGVILQDGIFVTIFFSFCSFEFYFIHTQLQWLEEDNKFESTAG